jgi:hypothetical protein
VRPPLARALIFRKDRRVNDRLFMGWAPSW